MMHLKKIINEIRNNQSKLIALFELIAGIILLSFEIRDFITLPEDPKQLFVMALFKYKEDTYYLLYLWTIMLFAGGSYWINKKLHWVLNQMFLATLLVAITLSSYFIVPPWWYWSIHQIPILFYLELILIVVIWIRMHKNSYLKRLGIEKKRKMKWVSVFWGVISMAIYFFLTFVTGSAMLPPFIR